MTMLSELSCLEIRSAVFGDVPICEECGAVFIKRRPNQTTCGDSCRWKSQRKAEAATVERTRE